MSDDAEIERLAASVRLLNAQYEEATARRRLQAARRPGWLPPSEFIAMALGIGATAAIIFLMLTLLNGSDSKRCFVSFQRPVPKECTRA